MKFLTVIFILIFTISVHGQKGVPNGKGNVGNVDEEIKPYSQEEYSSIQSYLEPYIFRGQGGRDPFKAPEISIPLVPGEVYGPFLPLQNFRLDQLRVKGLFWNIKEPTALVADPKGTIFKVGIKDYIGENFGYIASIREKEIVIIQTMEEDGQRYSTTKILFLDTPRSKK